MHQIRLSDQIYTEAQRLARAGGFPTVDDYVADVMALHIREEGGDFDHRFTADVIAHLKGIAAGIDAGEAALTNSQVDAQLPHLSSQRCG